MTDTVVSSGSREVVIGSLQASNITPAKALLFLIPKRQQVIYIPFSMQDVMSLAPCVLRPHLQRPPSVVRIHCAAAGQVETMARNLAEGGMRQMFGLMLRLMVKNSDAATMMRLNNTFQTVDPRVWDADMDVTANVGLGTGREEEKAMAYREVFGIQTQIMQAYGPSNGMVSLTNMRNTLADSLASAGIRNADRYFMPMNAEIEAQMMQAQQEQAQQAQGQQQPDPNAAYLQAEQMKAQARQQSDAMDMQLKSQKMMMDDDRARDQMAQDLAIKAAELLAKTGVQIDQNAIKREQAMNNQMPMGGM